MNATFGFVLVLVSGVMNGSFSLPMKRTPKWAWENCWLIWTFVGLVVVPWTVAGITVPDLFGVYSRSGIGAILLILCFGISWGLGAVAFGRAIAILGMSLAFAISVGLVTALGSFVPMAAKPATFLTPGGRTVTAGVIAMVFGVVLCAIAGGKKEAQVKKASKETQSSLSTGLFTKGLLICVFSGIMQPMLNFAFNFGGRVKETAIAAGATSGGGSDAIWVLALLGGLLPNAIYCSILLTKNRTWAAYRKEGTGSYWFLTVLMGLVWMLSVTLYGRAAQMMGTLGGSAGWAVFMGCCILVSNLWGIVTGEWREGRGKPIRTMYSGLVVLLISIAIIGYGNSLPH